MLSLTRKADYALVAMAELARRDPASVSAREVARSVRVPLPMLTNILHQLLRHGLVTSTMGSKGGYYLAKPAEEISLAEMIEATQGRFRFAPCCTDDPGLDEHVCNLEETCLVRDPVRNVHQSLRRFLSQVTLAHIAFYSEPIVLGLPGGAKRERVHVTGAAE